MIREQRQSQLTATDLIAKLLQSSQPAVVAEEHLEQLDQQFFGVANMFLRMAEQEGNTEVFEQLKAALKAAMEVKQKSLRPEIQLLNELLSAEDSAARRRLLNRQQAGETLELDGGYFFQLLQRVTKDLEAQPAHLPERAVLLEKLRDIRAEAEARLPAGAARPED